LYEQSYDAFSALGDEANATHLLLRLGHSALYRGDLARTRELADRSLAGSRIHGDLKTEAQATSLLGELEFAQGKRAEGLALLEGSAALCREAGFEWWRAAVLGKLVDRHLEQGDLGAAFAHARAALALASEQEDRLRIVRGLARLARIHAERGALERAGRLWGALEAEEERGPVGAWDVERERYATPVLAHAGREFELGREHGGTLELDAAVAEALGDD
jgi:hypothetical protein